MDRSTRPQLSSFRPEYVQIVTARTSWSDLQKLGTFQLVLILVWHFKPVTNTQAWLQACLQGRTEANVKTPLLHPHRLKNRLLSPNPLLTIMPHRKTHGQTTLNQRARCPLSCYICDFYMILLEDGTHLYPPDLIVLQTEQSFKGLDINATTRAEHG